jgi:hypothetical protein
MKNNINIICFTSLFTVLFLLNSCFINKNNNQSSTKTTVEKIDLKEKNFKINWDKRYIKENLITSLNILKKQHQKDPANLSHLNYLSRGYFILSFFHSSKSKDRKYYSKLGLDFGEKSLKVNKIYKNFNKNKNYKSAIEAIKKVNISGLYWTASNLGIWLQESDLITKLRFKNKLNLLIERVGNIDKSFYFYGYYRWKGKYFGLAPRFAGGDINKSHDFFTKAIKESPEYLYNHLYFAKYCLTKLNKKELFIKHLNIIKNFKLKKAPRIKSENIMAKKIANEIYKKTDEYFPL